MKNVIMKTLLTALPLRTRTTASLTKYYISERQWRLETGHPVVKLSDSVLVVSLIFYLRIDLDKECCDCALRSVEH